jgi:hypothetical protein
MRQPETASDLGEVSSLKVHEVNGLYIRADRKALRSSLMFFEEA